VSPILIAVPVDTNISSTKIKYLKLFIGDSKHTNYKRSTGKKLFTFFLSGNPSFYTFDNVKKKMKLSVHLNYGYFFHHHKFNHI